jgi:hypothetical protein
LESEYSARTPAAKVLQHESGPDIVCKTAVDAPDSQSDLNFGPLWALNVHRHLGVEEWLGAMRGALAYRSAPPLSGTEVQARFSKRQLSLPFSTISQRWLSRQKSSVVILASPNTLSHSPNAIFVVNTTDVRS